MKLETVKLNEVKKTYLKEKKNKITYQDANNVVLINEHYIIISKEQYEFIGKPEYVKMFQDKHDINKSRFYIGKCEIQEKTYLISVIRESKISPRFRFSLNKIIKVINFKRLKKETKYISCEKVIIDNINYLDMILE